jgi:cation transport protein ChaC
MNYSNTASQQGNSVVAPIMSRTLLEAGGMADLIRKDAPSLKLITDLERYRSLQETLAQRPAGDVWIFAYGSLIWNPAIRVQEQRKTRVEGWHRKFCVEMQGGRGSPEAPGLVLGLEFGGTCIGVAYRIAEEDLDTELGLLWEREMFSDAYIPCWVALEDQNDEVFASAITFVINPASNQYAGDLSEETIVRRLATAKGRLGTAADYLFRTRESLRANEIQDAELEWIGNRVEIEMAKRSKKIPAVPSAISAHYLALQ